MAIECPAFDCNRTFNSQSSLEQHLRNSSRHNFCFSCWIDFETPADLSVHQEQKGYCSDCDKCTGGAAQLAQHDVQEHGHCSECRIYCGSYEELKDHWSSFGIPHFSCPEYCGERFSTPANLQAHLNSAKHQEARILCPFRCDGADGDSRRFISWSAVAAHIDANGCTITRLRFNELAYDCDTRMTVIDEEEHPRDNISHVTILRILDTARRTGNYVCTYQGCSTRFGKYHGLRFHLQSPIHEVDMYKCPGCDARFKGMSGVFQHVASWMLDCRAVQVDTERKMKGIIDRVKQRFDHE